MAPQLQTKHSFSGAGAETEGTGAGGRKGESEKEDEDSGGREDDIYLDRCFFFRKMRSSYFIHCTLNKK